MINKKSKKIDYENLTYSELLKKFSKHAIKEIMARKEKTVCDKEKYNTG